MHTYQIQKATANVSVELEIIDATAGTPETGVLWNTSGIALEYRRDGAASTAITEATLAALTTAHTDGGFLHIGNGVYRLDLPDAACATGVDKVVIHGTVTGMIVIPCVIQLVDYDPFDAVRLGLTALPNAAADAAGGLPISDAGGLDLDAMNTNINDIETDTADMQPRVAAIEVDTGTTLDAALAVVDANVDAILVDTATTIPATITTAQADLDIITGADGVNLLTATQASIDAIETDTTTDIPASISALNNLGTADIATELATYDGPTNAEMEARTPTAAQLAYIVANAATGVPVTFTTAGGSTTAAVLNLVDGASASANNDHYNGRLLVFTNGTLKDVVTDITDYVGVGTTATITAVPFAPTASHTARLI